MNKTFPQKNIHCLGTTNDDHWQFKPALHKHLLKAYWKTVRKQNSFSSHFLTRLFRKHETNDNRCSWKRGVGKQHSKHAVFCL